MSVEIKYFLLLLLTFSMPPESLLEASTVLQGFFSKPCLSNLFQLTSSDIREENIIDYNNISCSCGFSFPFSSFKA